MNKANKHRRLILISSLLLILGLGLLFKSHILTGMFLVDYLYPEFAFSPLKIFTEEPLKEKLSYDAEGVTMVADLYSPRSFDKEQAILFYGPLAEKGNQDPDIIKAANSLARIGFTVLVPGKEVDAESGIVSTFMSPRDIEEVKGGILYLTNQGFSSIGIMGISYGAGPALIAASDPEFQDQVSFIVSVGGYVDFEEYFRFVLTGGAENGEFVEAHPYAKEVVKRSLQEWSAGPSFISAIDNTMSDEAFDRFLQRLPLKVRKNITLLSPLEYIDGLKAPVIIIHSTGDTLSPYQQSLQMAEVIPEDKRELVILSIFDHARVKDVGLLEIFTTFLPDITALYSAAHEVINR